MPNPPCVDFAKVGSLFDSKKHVFFEKDATTALQKLVEDDLIEINEPIRSNLHSFYVNLWSYSRSVPDRRRPIYCSEIIKRSLQEGPSFAKWIDGFKAYANAQAFDWEFFDNEVNETYKERGTLNDLRWDYAVGHMFRANSCFNWDAPKLDWIPIVCEPVINDQRALDLFRATARRYLEDGKFEFVEFPDFKDCISQSSKRTLDLSTKKSTDLWKIKKFDRQTKRGLTKIAHIPRELKEKRAAIMDEPNSAATIKWIDKSIGRLLALDKRNAMKLKAQTIGAKLNAMLKTRAWAARSAGTTTTSYCRDFKKEGLTRPRIINRIILEELHRAFPGESAFSNPGFFDQWSIITETGEIISAERGTGLGMFNNGVTFMQIILEEMNCDILGKRPKGSLYLNDDAAIVFEDKQSARKYASIDRQNCTALGLAFKAKGSFISEHSVVLCEQYQHKTNRKANNKDAFWTQEALLPLKAVNASHARELLSGANAKNVAADLIKESFDYWGWVLYRNEWNRPIVLGGWFRSSIQGVDVSFHKRRFDKKVCREENAAYHAYQETQLKYVPWLKDKGKTVPLKRQEYSRKTADILKIPEYLDAQSQFRPSANGAEVQRAWIAYEKQLRLNFKYCLRKPIINNLQAWRTAQNGVVSDIVPPSGIMAKGERITKVMSEDIDLINPYRTTKIEDEIEEFERTGNNEFCLKANAKNLKLTAYNPDQLPAATDAVWNLRAKHLPPGSFKKFWHAISLPQGVSLTNWINPLAVHAAIDNLTRGWSSFYIPTPWLTEERKELLAQRKKVFSQELDLQDWLDIGRYNPRDIQIVRAIYRYYNRDSKFKKILLEKMLQYPGLGSVTNFSVVANRKKLQLRIFKWWQYHYDHPEKSKSEMVKPHAPWINLDELLALFGEKINDPYAYEYDRVVGRNDEQLYSVESPFSDIVNDDDEIVNTLNPQEKINEDNMEDLYDFEDEMTEAIVDIEENLFNEEAIDEFAMDFIDERTQSKNFFDSETSDSDHFDPSSIVEENCDDFAGDFG